MPISMRQNLDGEVLSGVLAALAVSPVVAMVDKAVFSNASGKSSYTKSFKECGLMLLVNPPLFFKRTTFKWCFAVYASTFVTANCSDRLARLYDYNPRTTAFLATSAVNTSLSLMKDVHLTQTYSTKLKKPLTKGSYMCYIISYTITIIGAFTLVGPVADKIQEYVVFPYLARLISQSICPIAAQLLNTPFFIYGIDLYNRPNAKFGNRLRHMRKNYWDTYYWARVARVGPAYSVGGSLNWILRSLCTIPIPDKKCDAGHCDDR